MKQKSILIIAILAGLIAFWLTGQYLRHEQERMLGEAKRIFVIVANHELPAGSILKKHRPGQGFGIPEQCGRARYSAGIRAGYHG